MITIHVEGVSMPRSRTLACLAAAAVAVGSTALAQGPATAHERSGGDVEEVQIRDDCEVDSFNEVLGAGTCVGGGGTTVAEFFEELEETGAVDKWAFHPDEVDLDADEGLLAFNRGGEFHTFTQVAEFGGGCIPDLNGGAPPVPECEPTTDVGGGTLVPTAFLTTGVDAGEERLLADLAPGTYHFECLIHPWMRTTVHVGED